ncbi:MAG TPA: 6-carboxytetrahydropterin synthase [Candidatus Acidoferrales bacterium]|nr:6-carboxytetrahydropterin synthase [Candidatus Acidoferrales bacterium]
MKLSLSRRYSFPASHRLFRSEWSDEENLRVFGKCANRHGHGHNYTLEVSVTGPVDKQTGMIANLADLDEYVRRNVIEAFDHANLNEEIAEFRDAVPTTENLCRVVFKRLAGFPHARLERIRIEETGKNSFEFLASREA